VNGILGDADINEMLADLAEAGSAVEVTLGSTTVTGLFDRAAVQIFDGEMPTLIPDGEALHIKAGSLPGLVPAAMLTVTFPGAAAGTDYKVLRILPYGDGAVVRVALTQTT
jgi:hypothetical protein